ncbi:MAG: HAMP domain-containing protein [Rhodospirillales bacterium]|nr:HAMP domain-containing protein [Rhodospirillales bacterium]
MTAFRLWPGSLGGRTVAVLLAAVILVHLGSMAVYRESAVDAANTAQVMQLAERLATAAQAIVGRSASERDEAAHHLSSASLSLHWSERPLVDVAGGGDARLGALRDRLSALIPGTTEAGMRIDYADRQAAGNGHAILGSLRLEDNTFVNFRVPLLTDAAPMLHAALLSTSLMAGGIAVVAMLLMRSLVAPLRALAKAADAIGRGPGISVAERGPDEVRQVAQAFNAMQSRIERLIADRTQALAAVSHDLRTPITRLRLRAGFVADREAQGAIDADLDEMEAMIDATLAYLRGDIEPEEPRAMDLAALLTTLVDDAADAGRPASFTGPRHLVLPLRPLAVKRAFANLIDNALTYGGVARVTLRGDDAAVVVQIDDDGPGIPDDDLERVFAPFERLDGSRNSRTGGVGLGLSIVRQAIGREGGTARLSNRIEGGLRAEVVIPRGPEAAAEIASESQRITTRQRVTG